MNYEMNIMYMYKELYKKYILLEKDLKMHTSCMMYEFSILF